MGGVYILLDRNDNRWTGVYCSGIHNSIKKETTKSASAKVQNV